MNQELARYNMVEQQIRSAQPMSEDLRQLLLALPRELFVPPAYRPLAFSDVAIPLAEGEKMLSPSLDARIVQALAPRQHERVLEIGTGSGYTAALLAAHADSVVSYDRRSALAATARRNLHTADIFNVEVITADGFAESQAAQSFSLIVLSGAVAAIPPSLLAALTVGGRLLAFVGHPPCQVMRLLTRTDDGGYHPRDLCETRVALLRQANPPSAFEF
jgi:protein-L-isoaspartate(D-aspartate) O-methyltransferase